MTSGWSRLLGSALPVAAVLVIVVASIAMAGQLPDPMATRWPIGGTAEGPSPRALELVGGVYLVAISAAFVLIADRMPFEAGRRAVVVLANTASVAWAGQRLRMLTANHGVERWSDATPSIPVLAIVIAAALAGGWAWLATGLHQARRQP